MLYTFIAILIFGLLIATHELGHFATAKLLGVKVNEFAIGMGPAVFKRQKGETLYSFRAFPIGGYCAMEGEDDDSADPRAFGRAAGWKKIVILSAGAGMNFLAGLLILLALNCQMPAFALPTIAGFTEGFGAETCGIQPGDRVLFLNGHRMYNWSNFKLFSERAGDTIDLVVERDGVKVTLDDVYLPWQEAGKNEAGQIVYQRGLQVGRTVFDGNLGNKLRFTWYDAMDFVRMVWISLGDLASGQVGLRDLSGVVGITSTMAEVGNDPQLSPTAAAAAMNLANLAALIAVNLAVMNLLPLPALDGGRIFFLLLNGVLYALFRKKISPEHEGYVHMAGLALLMTLMLIVTVSDVGKLFGR